MIGPWADQPNPLQRAIEFIEANPESKTAREVAATRCGGSDCKHHARCSHDPGDDCFEPKPDTERCPLPAHIELSGDTYLAKAYASMLRMGITPSMPTKRIKLSGTFVTLDTIRAMRASR